MVHIRQLIFYNARIRGRWDYCFGNKLSINSSFSALLIHTLTGYDNSEPSLPRVQTGSLAPLRPLKQMMGSSFFYVFFFIQQLLSTFNLPKFVEISYLSITPALPLFPFSLLFIDYPPCFNLSGHGSHELKRALSLTSSDKICRLSCNVIPTLS